MQVRLIRSTSADGLELWSLTLDRRYTVLGIEADYFRLLDDTQRPYLFPPECFEVVEAAEPAFWVCSVDEGGERYCYPEPWNHPGFFEDYFDHAPTARDLFWKVYESHYRAEASEVERSNTALHRTDTAALGILSPQGMLGSVCR